jgi:CheY-like chemotaxis protein
MACKKGKKIVYRIVARSELGERYASAFEGMRMQTEDGRTILTGEIKDQPHLFGILDRINGLGLELLSVQALPEDANRSVLGQPDLEVLGEAGSLAEARTMLDGVDVALLDRGLPDGDGLKLMWPLREANPDARVLVMSATAEMRHPEDAMEAGADGVVDKLAPFELMFAAIRGQGGD